MNIKNISCVFLLFFSSLIHTSPFATRLMLASTDEKKQSHTNQLFIQAKKNAAEYINVRSQCLQANDCTANKEYRQARKLVISSIVNLIDYTNSFEDDDITDIDEKNEAKDIKNQLVQLLENTTKR